MHTQRQRISRKKISAQQDKEKRFESHVIFWTIFKLDSTTRCDTPYQTHEDGSTYIGQWLQALCSDGEMTSRFSVQKLMWLEWEHESYSALLLGSKFNRICSWKPQEAWFKGTLEKSLRTTFTETYGEELSEWDVKWKIWVPLGFGSTLNLYHRAPTRAYGWIFGEQTASLLSQNYSHFPFEDEEQRVGPCVTRKYE